MTSSTFVKVEEEEEEGVVEEEGAAGPEAGADAEEDGTAAGDKTTSADADTTILFTRPPGTSNLGTNKFHFLTGLWIRIKLFVDPDLAFFIADPDPAAFSMRIRIQIYQINNNLKSFPVVEIEKNKDCFKVFKKPWS